MRKKESCGSDTAGGKAKGCEKDVKGRMLFPSLSILGSC